MDDINKLQNADEGLSIYNQMVQMRPIPCPTDFHRLLGALLVLDGPSFVITIFQNMVAKGIRFNQDHETDHPMLQLGGGIFQQQRIRELECLFKKIADEDGGMWDVCESVIKGLCETGNSMEAVKSNLGEATRLMQKMMENGFPPSSSNYNTLVEGLCKLERMDELKKVLADMREFGLAPDLLTCKIVIDSQCKYGWIDSKVVFETIIESYCFCESGNVAEALSFLNKLEMDGVELNIEVYNTIIDGLGQRGEIDSARDILNSLSNKGLVPDVVTFNNMMTGLFAKGLAEEA
ncbi:OLC1v1005847C1 [Oldenlandia corymbosa var. corymbosa]|uniref:OLC1v1005847C1 n=1 Tax=Oldenlandia corymbosa var. corymbosa TaxID=529605 RepID=A0AAV1DI04_OLDCO|nr:OLC1v1005847C1 [Oldenlandia corymbosa var. corymbosa]